MPATSQKLKEAEETLPEELKPVFRRLVDEYEYLTSVHYGRGYVAYKVLADLVLAGWRPSAESRPPAVSSDEGCGRLHVLDSRTAVELVIWDISTGFLADPLPVS